MKRDARTPTPEELILLRRNLTDYFSDDELRTLCSKLGVTFEHLRGHGKAAKASELVRYFAARGRIPELVAHASRLRPNVSWGEMPADVTAGTGLPLERPVTPRGIDPTLAWLGGLVALLIFVAGLVFVLGSGLHLGRQPAVPGQATGTLGTVPAANTLAISTPTPDVIAVTAAAPTESFTPIVETVTPLVATRTPNPLPTDTPTPLTTSTPAPRAVTLLAPLNGVCFRSSVVTFKWLRVALGPGESFLVAIIPSEVNKGKCSSNYDRGVQISPPLTGYEWTTDISAPSQVPAACAGVVRWTVYVRNAAGSVTLVTPTQYFEWNPLKCIR